MREVIKERKVRMKQKAFVGKDCVSCGVCVHVCPVSAIHIYKGLYAFVNEVICIGCTKCSKSCPAEVIEMVKREVVI
jgi:MinD superfamily P-loop ATPase